MSATKELTTAILAIFRDRLNLEVPSAETDLIESGLMDSLSFVGLLAELEQHFGIHVEPEELEFDNFRSIEKIAAFVGARRAA
ncbi:MAG: acyl carrier protein [Planctomycetota bacterium]|jgi:acyl carrier protein